MRKMPWHNVHVCLEKKWLKQPICVLFAASKYINWHYLHGFIPWSCHNNIIKTVHTMNVTFMTKTQAITFACLKVPSANWVVHTTGHQLTTTDDKLTDITMVTTEGLHRLPWWLSFVMFTTLIKNNVSGFCYVQLLRSSKLNPWHKA